MALPTVTVNEANGTLGQTLQTDDGLAGMELVGVSEGSLVAGTPFSCISLADAQSKGLTLANNPIAFKEIGDFFKEAGDGATLWINLVANTVTVELMCDSANANSVVKLLDAAAGKIRLLGVMDDPAAYTPTITNGLNSKVATAKTNLAAIGATYFAANKPFRGIIAGENFSGDASALTDQTTDTKNRVAILIGDTTSGTNRAGIGQLLGRMASIPVMRKVSRKRTGALVSATAFIGTTDAAKYTTTSTIHDKGYITYRTFFNSAGYFYTGDPTCSATTDDYHALARGRVIDKAQILAYGVYVDELDNEVLINDDGTLNAGYCRAMEQQIENQINLTMKAKNEISDVRAFVDPAQPVLSTNQVNVTLKIIPVGYSDQIVVTLGFATSF
jgi:hypothetical protein